MPASPGSPFIAAGGPQGMGQKQALVTAVGGQAVLGVGHSVGVHGPEAGGGEPLIDGGRSLRSRPGDGAVGGIEGPLEQPVSVGRVGAEEDEVGEVEGGEPVLGELVVLTIAVVEAHAVASVEPFVDDPRGLVGELGAGRVGPLVLRSRLGSEEGARGDEGLDEVLVGREAGPRDRRTR